MAGDPASKDRYERAHERQSQWVASEVERSERESKRALAQSGPGESTGAAPSKGPVRDVEMGARGPEGTGATSSSGPVRKVELGLSQPAGGLQPVLNWALGTPGQGAKQRLRSANWRTPSAKSTHGRSAPRALINPAAKKICLGIRRKGTTRKSAQMICQASGRTPKAPNERDGRRLISSRV